MTKSGLITVLMDRDGITRDEAIAQIKACGVDIRKAIAENDLMGAEDAIMSHLGLEPDYLDLWLY